MQIRLQFKRYRKFLILSQIPYGIEAIKIFVWHVRKHRLVCRLPKIRRNILLPSSDPADSKIVFNRNWTSRDIWFKYRPKYLLFCQALRAFPQPLQVNFGVKCKRVEVNFTQEESTKAQRGRRGIALLFP